MRLDIMGQKLIATIKQDWRTMNLVNKQENTSSRNGREVISAEKAKLMTNNTEGINTKDHSKWT